MRDCFGKTKLFFTLYFLVFFPRVSACGLRGSSHLVSELVINERSSSRYGFIQRATFNGWRFVSGSSCCSL